MNKHCWLFHLFDTTYDHIHINNTDHTPQNQMRNFLLSFTIKMLYCLFQWYPRFLDWNFSEIMNGERKREWDKGCIRDFWANVAWIAISYQCGWYCYCYCCCCCCAVAFVVLASGRKKKLNNCAVTFIFYTWKKQKKRNV